MLARCSSVRNGAGASSTSFWWRRCSEQSRVPTTITLPCWSASTCASTWRGGRGSARRSTRRGRTRRPPRGSPTRTAPGSPRSSRATLSPRPPPPNAALMATGRPCSLGEGDDLVGAGDRVRRAGDQRRAGPRGDVPGRHLVAEVADRLRRRADPGQPGVDHGLGEVGVLGRGSRSRGAPRRRRTARRRRASCRCAGRSRRGCRRPARTPRRRAGRAGRRGRGRRRPRRCEPGVAAGPDDPYRDLAPVGDEHLAAWPRVHHDRRVALASGVAAVRAADAEGAATWMRVADHPGHRGLDLDADPALRRVRLRGRRDRRGRHRAAGVRRRRPGVGRRSCGPVRRLPGGQARCQLVAAGVRRAVVRVRRSSTSDSADADRRRAAVPRLGPG